MMTLLLALTLLGQCPCGPDCPGPGICPCGCGVGQLACVQELPTLAEAVRICRLTRRPICLWVGRTDPDAQAAFPEAIHCYKASIGEKPGSGVCVARWDGSDLSGWTWFGGPSARSDDLRLAAGVPVVARRAPRAAPLYLPGPAWGGCGPGGFAGGGCAGGR